MTVNITVVHKIPCTYNLRHRNVAIRADVPLGNAMHTPILGLYFYIYTRCRYNIPDAR